MSNMVQNQPKNYPNGSGTTRSPGLVFLEKQNIYIYKNKYIFDKVVELVGGGSVINGATLSSHNTRFIKTTVSQLDVMHMQS